MTNQDKAEVSMRIFFPGEQPFVSEQDLMLEEREEEDRGGSTRSLEESDQAIEEAIKSQRDRKAPGIDGMGAPVLRLLWNWARERVYRLFIECTRLGIHCRIWKSSRGVLIPKPNKENMGDCKSY